MLIKRCLDWKRSCPRLAKDAMKTPEVNPDRALCATTYRQHAHLWDADLDAGVKHKVAETAEQKEIRHSIARAVCNICDERLVCRWVGLNKPGREGMYGGDLV